MVPPRNANDDACHRGSCRWANRGHQCWLAVACTQTIPQYSKQHDVALSTPNQQHHVSDTKEERVRSLFRVLVLGGKRDWQVPAHFAECFSFTDTRPPPRLSCKHKRHGCIFMYCLHFVCVFCGLSLDSAGEKLERSVESLPVLPITLEEVEERTVKWRVRRARITGD